jgi:hypothetical protein
LKDCCEQKFECDQALEGQVYYNNEDGEDLLVYEEKSIDSFDSNAPRSFQGGTILFLVLEDKGQDLIEQNDISMLKEDNQPLIEISNNSKLIHDRFDFQEVSVQDKFKIDDEKLGLQGFPYHQQMQSFVLDKDNKEEQISQTTSS